MITTALFKVFSRKIMGIKPEIDTEKLAKSIHEDIDTDDHWIKTFESGVDDYKKEKIVELENLIEAKI